MRIVRHKNELFLLIHEDDRLAYISNERVELTGVRKDEIEEVGAIKITGRAFIDIELNGYETADGDSYPIVGIDLSDEEVVVFHDKSCHYPVKMSLSAARKMVDDE